MVSTIDNSIIQFHKEIISRKEITQIRDKMQGSYFTFGWSNKMCSDRGHSLNYKETPRQILEREHHLEDITNAKIYVTDKTIEIVKYYKILFCISLS